jgi:hypothetical protein
MAQKQAGKYSSMKAGGKQKYYPEDGGVKILRNIG